MADASLCGTVACGSGFSVCIGKDGSLWEFGRLLNECFGTEQDVLLLCPTQNENMQNAEFVSSSNSHIAIIDYDNAVGSTIDTSVFCTWK